MTDHHSNNFHFSRRRFMQIMAGASLATATGVIPGLSEMATAASRRKVSLPRIKVRTAAPSAERYQFQPELKRFPDQHKVWKIVSNELGASGTRYARNFNMVRNIREGKIGYGVPVKDPIEARLFMALNIAASTWNTFVGPNGSGR